MMIPGSEHPTDLLSAFLDGETGASETVAVQEHLERCAQCRALLDDLRRLGQAAGSEPIPPPPSDLAARIQLKIAQARKELTWPARGHGGRSTFPLCAAAGLVVVLGLIWYLQRQGGPAPTAPEERPPLEVSAPPQAIAPPPKTASLQSDAGAPASRIVGLEARKSSEPLRREATAGEADEPTGDAADVEEQVGGGGVEGVVGGVLGGMPGSVEPERPQDQQEYGMARGAVVDSVEGGMAAAAAAAPSAEIDKTGGRSATVMGLNYTVRVSEEGLVNLKTTNYDCTVRVELLKEGKETPAAAALAKLLGLDSADVRILAEQDLEPGIMRALMDAALPLMEKRCSLVPAAVRRQFRVR